MKKPNPGSDEAVEMGCICPRMDNGYGKGHYRGGFAIALDCIVHGTEKKPLPEL